MSKPQPLDYRTPSPRRNRLGTHQIVGITMVAAALMAAVVLLLDGMLIGPAGSPMPVSPVPVVSSVQSGNTIVAVDGSYTQPAVKIHWLACIALAGVGGIGIGLILMVAPRQRASVPTRILP